MSTSAVNSNWQVVPYVGSTPFKRMRVRDDARIRAVVRHLQAHECVTLIGPPFSEKSRLLDDVAAALQAPGLHRPFYLDLWLTNSQDESTFFASLGQIIGQALGEDAAPREPVTTPREFQNFLLACAERQPAHLVLLVDHLQALPYDLVHSFLVALRAAYMEMAVDAPHQLAAVVTGGMNLVGLSAGTTSPFNIAKPVIAAPLDDEQSVALAEATFDAGGWRTSRAALARVVEWAGGDRYLLPRLCVEGAELVKSRLRPTVDCPCIDRAAEHLLGLGGGHKAPPIREAIRSIEEDTETMLDVLYLLQHESLLRSRAHQMPTRTGLDRLQLSGAVVLKDGAYRFKNRAYSAALADHFTTERVGHLLRINGCWQASIAYLAPRIKAQPDPEAQSQLLEATVQSIYASDSLARAYELLAHGLQDGFGLVDMAIYRTLPSQDRLALVQTGGRGADRPQSLSLRDEDSVETRTYRHGSYALRGATDDARLVAALNASGRRLGIVVVEGFGPIRNPHETPSTLPDLLHFLDHAASAIESVIIRSAYREIGQAVLDSGTMQPTLHRVLEAASDALGCEVAHLYLLDSGRRHLEMASGVGRVWNLELQALARYDTGDDHPAVTCLRDDTLRIVAGTDERLNRTLVSRFGLQDYSWAFLPLRAAGQELGTLELGYHGGFRGATSDDSRADLVAFANQVAIAVHNMQLLRLTDEALARRVAELEKLRASSLAISASLDVATVLDRMIHDLRSLFPGTETTVWAYDAGERRLSVMQSSLTDKTYLDQQLGLESITGKAVSGGVVRFIDDLTTLAGADHDPAVQLGLRTLITAPLVTHDRVLGAISLYAYGDAPSVLDEGTAELLEAFAANAGVAIDNARMHQEEIERQKLEQELLLAQTLQRSLLPKSMPTAAGWQFAAAYRLARVVGGDFYDFIELRGAPPRVGIVMADVTDKGIPAAIFMALSRTIIRTMAFSGRGPAAALSRANSLILNDSHGDFWLTCVYAILELSSGRLIYANGGHNRPYLYRAAQRQVVELDAPGTILGAFEGIELTEERVDLEPDDVLLFYTDGITDAGDVDGCLFGEERLIQLLEERAGATADSILAAILDAVAEFTLGAEQTDDITCVVVKRLHE